MAETRKLLAEFSELLIPERSTFTSSWARFLERFQRAGAEEVRELGDFLHKNLPVSFYNTRDGGVEFLGGDLLARRVRCYAWCFKQMGIQALSGAAREWCEEVARAETSGTLDDRGLEDIVSAKFAVRTLLNGRAGEAKARFPAPEVGGRAAPAGAHFPSRLSFSVLSA